MSSSINLKLVFKIIGFLLLLEGGFMLTALIPAFYYKEGDFLPILYSAFLTITVGFILWFSFKKREEENIGKREGYIVVTTAWVFFSIFGALPYILSHTVDNYTDAFFETMSGFTTTGATILEDIEAAPKGILFWRSITQWLGGMGIIVLSLSVLPMLGIGGISLFIAEVPGPTKEKIHPRIKETAKRLWFIYIIFTFIESVLLKIGGMDYYDALCHSFTTMSSGGFSTKSDSIAAFSPFIQYVIIFFMILSGINFTLHYFALYGKFRKVFQNEELKYYLLFISVATLLIFTPFLIFEKFNIEAGFRDALFQTVSIITTTGYTTVDYMSWHGASWFVLFLLFFIGGCSGSTSGGVKVARQIFLIKNSSNELKRLIHPNAVIPIRYNGKPVPQQGVYNVLAFFLFYTTIFAFGALFMSMMSDIDFETAIGASASCLGNVGPAIGAVGPSFTFNFIPDIGKWFLTFMMLMGRLELFTVLILLTPAFWKR